MSGRWEFLRRNDDKMVLVVGEDLDKEKFIANTHLISYHISAFKKWPNDFVPPISPIHPKPIS
jgi:hypothetical protein